MIGLFCPLLILQPYAFWLLIKVLGSEQRLAPAPRRRAIVAALINLPTMFTVALLVRLILTENSPDLVVEWLVWLTDSWQGVAG